MPARKRRLAAVALVLLAVLALFGWLSRPQRPRYTVTDLGVLPGVFMSGPPTSSASGINAQGDVVGLSGPERITMRHAFLYRNGVMTDLGPSGLFSSHWGPAINDGGQVTGVMRVTVPLSVSVSGRQFHASLYDAGGMHDLGHPLGASVSMGDAINSRGQIAGEAWADKPVAGGRTSHAFLDSGGKVMDIGALPGCISVTPAGINTAGQVVGYLQMQNSARAFLYDAGTRKMTALTTPPRFSEGYAAGINDRGQVIGTVAARNRQARAVFWVGGRVTNLGALPGMDEAEGTAVNNRGEAVGLAYAGQGAIARFVSDHPIRMGFLIPLFGQGRKGSQVAFLYRAGRMEDLNRLIPAHSGWVLQEAQGINDRGQIVGTGLHHGQKRAFLLTPLTGPEGPAY